MADRDAPDKAAPAKLIYPLEHAYTPAEIGFAGLKNADTARAAALVSAPGRAPQTDGWRRPEPLTPDFIVDLLTALHRLEALSMAEAAVDHWLAWPRSFPSDTMLIPATLSLTAQTEVLRNWAPGMRLLTAFR